MAWAQETFAAFESRPYRLLWSSGLLATTAFMMSFMLMPAVAYEITGNNTDAGIATMGSGVGMFLISPIGGVIADRVHKKPLIIAGQTVPGLVILVLGLLIVTDQISILSLTLGALIMGVAFAFLGPARRAWVAELVPGRLLASAVAHQQIAITAALVVAPLLIAILVSSSVGVGGTYLVMASLFLLILPLTHRLPNTPPPVPAERRRSIRLEMSEGARYVLGDPRLRLLWAAFMALIICGFAFQTLLPGLLDRELGREPTDIGLIFLVFAIAGLIGNLPLARLVHTPLAWPGMLVMGGVMAGGFGLLAASTTYEFALICAIPLGLGRSGFMLLNQTLLMLSISPAFYGRVMSFAVMAFGMQALLAPVWGALADSIGMRETLSIVGGVAAVAVLLTALAWLRIRTLPRSTLVPVTADASG